jgi:hypothetical protein
VLTRFALPLSISTSDNFASRRSGLQAHPQQIPGLRYKIPEDRKLHGLLRKPD